MKDLTIHRDFSRSEIGHLERAIHRNTKVLLDKLDFNKEQNFPTNLRLKFKNDVAQGTRKQREREQKYYKDSHYFGHMCERCGKKIGIIPGDSDRYGGLCKECEEEMELEDKQDFVTKEMNRK